jgi:hypothetical protein
MNMHYKWAALGAVAATALAVGAAQAQQQAGGTATYWMSAETSSGMGAMMGGGNPAAMAAMMSGRSAAYAQNLTLQLGAGQKPAAAPSAEHLPPAGLKAGTSLPLVSPLAAKPQPTTGGLPPGYEKPKGRMLIYWGCGEKARAGQPVVIDFATMAAGKMPAAFSAVSAKAMTPPSAASHRTYGEWPNDKSKTRVPAGGSLAGAHVVRGNYTPEISFNLAAGQDFLAPVTLTANSASPSGSYPLVWRAVSGAQAWFVSAMGAAENGDMVMWSSSETQAMPMWMDYLAPEEARRLVQQKVLLPATADRCTVPSDVAKAVPQAMLTVTAFGGETNVAQPKPAAAPASWRPQWNVKLRTRSVHMAMLGMDMSDMMGGDGGDDGDGDREAAQAPRKDTKKDKIRKGLGRILGQ